MFLIDILIFKNNYTIQYYNKHGYFLCQRKSLLVEDFNYEVKTFKSRIIYTTYLYVKNKNISEIQKDMGDYLQLELMKLFYYLSFSIFL